MFTMLPVPLAIMSKFTILNIWGECLKSMSAGLKMQFVKSTLVNNKCVIYGSIIFIIGIEVIMITFYLMNYVGITAIAVEYIAPIFVITLTFFGLLVTFYTLKVNR